MSLTSSSNSKISGYLGFQRQTMKMVFVKEKVGKNVVHKRLQVRGADPASEQSLSSHREIAAQCLERHGNFHFNCR